MSISTLSPLNQAHTPVMLAHLAQVDVIALDAAVSTGAAGERARRLLENRKKVAPHHLPHLLLTTHTDEEYRIAQERVSHFRPFVDSLEVILEKGRNETATHALTLHRTLWPEVSEPERKERVLLLESGGRYS